jgi:hypothetical protein
VAGKNCLLMFLLCLFTKCFTNIHVDLVTSSLLTCICKTIITGSKDEAKRTATMVLL